MSSTKYPNVRVNLIGQDGNAFFILGAVLKALKNAGVEKEKRDEYTAAAQSGDYDHLLAVTKEWVTIV